MYLWAHPEQTACGCYLFPVDATAADLSMSSASLADALSEFHRRLLVDLDPETGELMLPDWFRWYRPRTPAACGAVEASIKKIRSLNLHEKVQKSYESIAPPWKGKEKEKVKDKEAAARAHARAAFTDLADAAASSVQGKKSRDERASGLVTWEPSDLPKAEKLEQQHSTDVISAAVSALKAAGKEPVPGLVTREIERQMHSHKAAARRAADEAAHEERLRTTPLDPDAVARGLELLSPALRARITTSMGTKR